MSRCPCAPRSDGAAGPCQTTKVQIGGQGSPLATAASERPGLSVDRARSPTTRMERPRAPGQCARRSPRRPTLDEYRSPVGCSGSRVSGTRRDNGRATTAAVTRPTGCGPFVQAGDSLCHVAAAAVRSDIERRGGANTGGRCGASCSTRDGSPSLNGNGSGGSSRARCVARPIQEPARFKRRRHRHNNGYECDGNPRVGRHPRTRAEEAGHQVRRTTTQPVRPPAAGGRDTGHPSSRRAVVTPTNNVRHPRRESSLRPPRAPDRCGGGPA